MTAPYELWNTRRSLGVMRDVEPAFTYWTDLCFGQQINFDTEYVDFEKIPVSGRKLAPFVKPLGSGKPIYTDQSTGARFKPAYIKVKDVVDPTRPLTKIPGLESMLEPSTLTPMQRRDALKAAITVQHVTAIQRRWEWLACRAAVDGAVTIVGEEYPAVTVDFQRASNHTITLSSGNRWGDSGVSIFTSIQTFCDRMFNAPFGGFPTRLTVTPKAWAVMRVDAEFMKHMDTQIRGAAATIERGLIGADKVIKVGELNVGGQSGAVIEIFLYRDTYQADDGTETPFLTDGDIVLTCSKERIQGYRCFGAIVDPHAKYQSLDIFPRNWLTNDDPAVEWMLHQSAPLMVPVNPNATLKATVTA